MNKAAERLYVSQPSLTSSVKELEKELGITLFYRSGRGVTLTNDGAEFLLYAKQIYSQYENVLEKYGKGGPYKKKFGVSAQHYSFAVKAFVDMVKGSDMSEYGCHPGDEDRGGDQRCERDEERDRGPVPVRFQPEIHGEAVKIRRS